jgi:hypothetical protein
MSEIGQEQSFSISVQIARKQPLVDQRRVCLAPNDIIVPNGGRESDDGAIGE